jgi:hypothetical protein
MATRTYSVTIGAGGTGTVTIKTDSPESWTVAQVSIEMPSAPSGATAELRKNDYLVTPMIAAGDVAAGEPYVLILPSDILTLKWIGCTPGAIGKVLVFYAVDSRNA